MKSLPVFVLHALDVKLSVAGSQTGEFVKSASIPLFSALFSALSVRKRSRLPYVAYKTEVSSVRKRRQHDSKTLDLEKTHSAHEAQLPSGPDPVQSFLCFICPSLSFLIPFFSDSLFFSIPHVRSPSLSFSPSFTCADCEIVKQLHEKEST